MYKPGLDGKPEKGGLFVLATNEPAANGGARRRGMVGWWPVVRFWYVRRYHRY